MVFCNITMAMDQIPESNQSKDFLASYHGRKRFFTGHCRAYGWLILEVDQHFLQKQWRAHAHPISIVNHLARKSVERESEPKSSILAVISPETVFHKIRMWRTILKPSLGFSPKGKVGYRDEAEWS